MQRELPYVSLLNRDTVAVMLDGLEGYAELPGRRDVQPAVGALAAMSDGHCDDEAVSGDRTVGWHAYSGRTLPANVRALALVSLLQDVASEMVYPLLPGFLALLGGGAVALGAMESAAEGVLALVKGWAGRASDRLGRRKPFVLWGYGLSAAARPLLAVAAAPLHVVLVRTADRFAKGLRTAPRDALIADSTVEKQRGFAFSYHRGLDHLGAAVGPLLAAGVLAVAPGELRLVFALATVPAVLAVFVVWRRVREVGRGWSPRGSAPTCVGSCSQASKQRRISVRRDGLQRCGRSLRALQRCDCRCWRCSCSGSATRVMRFCCCVPRSWGSMRWG